MEQPDCQMEKPNFYDDKSPVIIEAKKPRGGGRTSLRGGGRLIPVDRNVEQEDTTGDATGEEFK